MLRVKPGYSLWGTDFAEDVFIKAGWSSREQDYE